MSRCGFTDIFAGRGLLGSLYSPDMEGVVPQQGVLAGFDYRTPYQNESVGNQVLSQTDADFNAPVQPSAPIWLTKTLADDQAANQPDKFFSGPTPADVDAAVGESQTVQPRPIPRSYFDTQSSAFENIKNIGGAFGRAIATGVAPDLGDQVSAGMGALTGIGGNRGDYEGNLRRQHTNSALAAIRNPDATSVGEAVGRGLDEALAFRGLSPRTQDTIKKSFKG